MVIPEKEVVEVLLPDGWHNVKVGTFKFLLDDKNEIVGFSFEPLSRAMIIEGQSEALLAIAADKSPHYIPSR